MSEITIEKGKPEDLKHLQQLYSETVMHVCSTDYDEVQINAWIKSTENKEKWQDIVTGSLASKRGPEIIANNKVALTFWWTETERQVRIQGSATKIPEQLANKYFKERNRDSQIVSIVSEQGKEIDNNDDLNKKKYNTLQKQLSGNPLSRPNN